MIINENLNLLTAGETRSTEPESISAEDVLERREMERMSVIQRAEVGVRVDLQRGVQIEVLEAVLEKIKEQEKHDRS